MPDLEAPCGYDYISTSVFNLGQVQNPLVTPYLFHLRQTILSLSAIKVFKVFKVLKIFNVLLFKLFKITLNLMLAAYKRYIRLSR